MFKATAFMALEKIVNITLSRDENSMQRLAVLEDKIICIEFTDISLNMFWLFEKSNVPVINEPKRKPIIKGTRIDRKFDIGFFIVIFVL